MNIADIKWPKEKKKATLLYINFQIKIIEYFKIEFPKNFENPIVVTKNYIKGEISEDVYLKKSHKWWDYLNSFGGVQNFQSKEILIGRLAICLLSVGIEEYSRLGEHLSWFFEVLEFMGINLSTPIKMMDEYFPH